jgi:hypothetical protein
MAMGMQVRDFARTKVPLGLPAVPTGAGRIIAGKCDGDGREQLPA